MAIPERLWSSQLPTSGRGQHSDRKADCDNPDHRDRRKEDAGLKAVGNELENRHLKEDRVTKIPRNAAESQRTYWWTSDLSSPISTRTAATASGVAWSPSMTAAGSPGINRMKAKTRNDDARRVGTNTPIRRIR